MKFDVSILGQSYFLEKVSGLTKIQEVYNEETGVTELHEFAAELTGLCTVFDAVKPACVPASKLMICPQGTVFPGESRQVEIWVKAISLESFQRAFLFKPTEHYEVPFEDFLRRMFAQLVNIGASDEKFAQLKRKTIEICIATKTKFALFKDIFETPREKSTVCRCSFCGEPSKWRCTGCKAHSYCSEACQKSDWPEHKLRCKICKTNRKAFRNAHKDV